MTGQIWAARVRLRWLLVGMLAVSGLALGACGGSAHPGRESASVTVVLDNFKIDMPRVVHAGVVHFVVKNSGPTMHEFNVARTDLAPSELPVSAAGIVDDTDPEKGFTHIGEVEGIDIGQRKTLTVTLSPGEYVVYCNMDGHYEAGMAGRVTVVR